MLSVQINTNHLYTSLVFFLTDPIQMAVTFKDGSKVTLLNDTTLTIPTLPIQTLECWVQNGLGTPELWRNGDPVLLNDIPLDESVAPILSTNSVRVNVPNAGYYMCSVSHGEVFVFRLTVGELHPCLCAVVAIDLIMISQFRQPIYNQ